MAGGIITAQADPRVLRGENRGRVAALVISNGRGISGKLGNSGVLHCWRSPALNPPHSLQPICRHELCRFIGLFLHLFSPHHLRHCLTRSSASVYTGSPLTFGIPCGDSLPLCLIARFYPCYSLTTKPQYQQVPGHAKFATALMYDFGVSTNRRHFVNVFGIWKAREIISPNRADFLYD